MCVDSYDRLPSILYKLLCPSVCMLCSLLYLQSLFVFNFYMNWEEDYYRLIYHPYISDKIFYICFPEKIFLCIHCKIFFICINDKISIIDCWQNFRCLVSWKKNFLCIPNKIFLFLTKFSNSDGYQNFSDKYMRNIAGTRIIGTGQWPII